jgi:hypothetical protein
VGRGGALIEHDPEKWKPVFGKDHAQTKGWSGMAFLRKAIALAADRQKQERPETG